ncbi:lysophospholipid acyltransferase family protein [Ekhidna sp.]|jgi:1-acyl-sn-glycerol-3-phosphate acyltransferase|uniref:lysophospholipid acyltransferase family protein n=1 Tax=Ekhidna sp. TaxID=2608089 RepID=UPI0032EFC5D9
MAKKNIFGQSIWFKKRIFQTVGRLVLWYLLKPNKVVVSGSKILTEIPDKNVLFIANHQTIFTDVIAMFHAMFAALNGQVDSIDDWSYLKNPKVNVYYVAARETMEKGLLAKVLALAGAVTVDRTWRKGDEMIKREVNPDDTKSIGMAIKDGWVVTFPQGTTRQGAPVRKGTAHIIKQHKPVVIPVRVDGFREAFDKTGIKRLKKGVTLSLKFGEPMDIDYENESVEELVKKIGVAIGEDNPIEAK